MSVQQDKKCKLSNTFSQYGTKVTLTLTSVLFVYQLTLSHFLSSAWRSSCDYSCVWRCRRDDIWRVRADVWSARNNFLPDTSDTELTANYYYRIVRITHRNSVWTEYPSLCNFHLKSQVEKQSQHPCFTMDFLRQFAIWWFSKFSIQPKKKKKNHDNGDAENDSQLSSSLFTAKLVLVSVEYLKEMAHGWLNPLRTLSFIAITVLLKAYKALDYHRNTLNFSLVAMCMSA